MNMHSPSKMEGDSSVSPYTRYASLPPIVIANVDNRGMWGDMTMSVLTLTVVWGLHVGSHCGVTSVHLEFKNHVDDFPFGCNHLEINK